jgi:hypothetical protein
MTCFYRACFLKAMFTYNGDLEVYYQKHVISGYVFEFASDHIRWHKNNFHAENALKRQPVNSIWNSHDTEILSGHSKLWQ